jgi:hypothetical protein
MKRILFLAAILTLAVSHFGQSPSKIVGNAEKALGGKKAIKAASSWKAVGTITDPATARSGRFQMQVAAPNFFHIAYDLDGFDYESGHNGRSGWVRDSRSGLRTLTGQSSLDLQSEAAYRASLWLDHKRQRAKLSLAPRSKVGGKSANVVNFTSQKGTSIRVYFDRTTNLPIRDEIVGEGQMRTFTYSDYRPVGKILRPHTIEMSVGDSNYNVTIERYETIPVLVRSDFDFPKNADEPLPDIVGLLRDLQANEDKVEDLLDTYSYVQKNISRELGNDGVLRETGSETVQLSFYKGNRIRRLIEKDGKLLSESDQRDEDKQVGKRVEEIEKKIAKAEKKGDSGPPSENGQRVSIAELLRASKLINPRRERFRGRDVIVFDFEPNPDFNYKNAKSMLKFFGKTAGVMWIDENDKQVARLEAYLADSFNVGGGVLAKLKKGATFTLEQQRVNDEIWLPSTADINLSVRVLLVKGVNINQVVKSYDYRKFATEVKDASVDSSNRLQ